MKYVCDRCVKDEALSALISEEGQERSCAYCNPVRRKKQARTFSIPELAEQILERITWDYGDVDSEMISWDFDNQEYTVPTYTTAQLLSEIGLDVPQAVLADLDHELPDSTWCKRRFGGGNISDALAMGRAAFCETTKHEIRYFFPYPEPDENVTEFPRPQAFNVEYNPDEGVAPGRILEALRAILRRVDLTKRIDVGTRIFRARVHRQDEKPSTASDLGPPKSELACSSNRMSPAGIVMFYGAFDLCTAVNETFDRELKDAAEKVVTVAQFEVQTPINVLSLTELPNPPSLFGDYELHHGLSFLWDFEKDFVKPVARDGKEHYEYVPTQIVTEYL